MKIAFFDLDGTIIHRKDGKYSYISGMSRDKLVELLNNKEILLMPYIREILELLRKPLLLADDQCIPYHDIHAGQMKEIRTPWTPRMQQTSEYITVPFLNFKKVGLEPEGPAKILIFLEEEGPLSGIPSTVCWVWQQRPYDDLACQYSLLSIKYVEDE